MTPIKSTDTPYGPVILYQSGSDFFVKSGKSWVTYVYGNAGYSHEARKMNEVQALKMFDAAVQDSRIVYEATHPKEVRKKA